MHSILKQTQKPHAQDEKASFPSLITFPSNGKTGVGVVLGLILITGGFLVII